MKRFNDRYVVYIVSNKLGLRLGITYRLQHKLKKYVGYKLEKSYTVPYLFLGKTLLSVLNKLDHEQLCLTLL